jgi:hypothetical protein
VFKRYTKDKVVTFRTISLYGFTDMATFFKKKW